MTKEEVRRWTEQLKEYLDFEKANVAVWKLREKFLSQDARDNRVESEV